MEEPGFWDDAQNSTKIVKELKSLKDSVKAMKDLEQQYEDIETMMDMADEEDDKSLISEIRSMIGAFSAELEKTRISTLLTGEYDENNAVVGLNAGAGGTEACDFNSMLYRMYTRWTEAHGFSIKVLDYQPGDEAGIKSVTFQVNGENAYGFLKSEAGVHRLVRISPFNDRYIQSLRRRRTAHQQDLISSQDNPPSHGYSLRLPGGEKPVPQQGDSHADAQGKAVYDQGTGPR